MANEKAKQIEEYGGLLAELTDADSNIQIIDKGGIMKKIIMFAMLAVQISTVCFAEIFIWEDKNGIHIEEDISKLPPKFHVKYLNYLKQTPKQEIPKTKVEKEKESRMPESANNAVKALRKLNARCEAGVSYRDFAPAIGDAKFEVNLYLESKEAQEHLELANSIRKTIAHYMAANDYLGVKVVSPCVSDEKVLNSFFSKYPNADRHVLSCYSRDDEYVSMDKIVNYVLLEASKELKTAMNILSEDRKN